MERASSHFHPVLEKDGVGDFFLSGLSSKGISLKGNEIIVKVN